MSLEGQLGDLNNPIYPIVLRASSRKKFCCTALSMKECRRIQKSGVTLEQRRGISGTTRGTYTLTVTGTSGPIAAITSVSLVVL